MLVSIPKVGKNLYSSENYRAIALASLSKVLEWCLLIKFAPFFTCSDLQFGFKEGLSTCSCTGVLKKCQDSFKEVHLCLHASLMLLRLLTW